MGTTTMPADLIVLVPAMYLGLGRLAARALCEEATLTPKPGLVDARGGGAHDDMSVALLIASADALAIPIAECAEAASSLPLGRKLRAEIGEIGRAGEMRMLQTTGGVNTHRGALWVLGLLAAGLAATENAAAAASFAAQLARLPDPAAAQHDELSHGARARINYGALGARGEAQAGFPNTVDVALPALIAARAAGLDEREARIHALLTSMANLEDTCILHRAGADGLQAVRRGAEAVLSAGGRQTEIGRALFDELDDMCHCRGLSPGGSADVLAAAIFLDSAKAFLEDRSS
jgi:triphosphoribosyl-dephospho-CoA synthase